MLSAFFIIGNSFEYPMISKIDMKNSIIYKKCRNAGCIMFFPLANTEKKEISAAKSCGMEKKI